MGYLEEEFTKQKKHKASTLVLKAGEGLVGSRKSRMVGGEALSELEGPQRKAERRDSAGPAGTRGFL